MEINVVYFKNKNLWIGNGIKYDIAAQGETLEKCTENLTIMIAMNSALDMEKGIEPLSQWNSSPDYIKEMYDKGIEKGIIKKEMRIDNINIEFSLVQRIYEGEPLNILELEERREQNLK